MLSSAANLLFRKQVPQHHNCHPRKRSVPSAKALTNAEFKGQWQNFYTSKG